MDEEIYCHCGGTPELPVATYHIASGNDIRRMPITIWKQKGMRLDNNKEQLCLVLLAELFLLFLF